MANDRDIEKIELIEHITMAHIYGCFCTGMNCADIYIIIGWNSSKGFTADNWTKHDEK